MGAHETPPRGGFDPSGWWMGRTVPWLCDEAWTLFARDDDSRMVEAAWLQQARRFFGAEVRVQPRKRYPGGSQPRRDRAEIVVTSPSSSDYVTSVAPLSVQTFPADDDPALRARGVAVGTSGMEVLVARSPRTWQWRRSDVEGDGDPRGALVFAALLASLRLGPVLPPGAATLFGVRGARLRLREAGWQTPR
ncbi:MAG: hypothetical protein AAF928_11335 [Myxococcota bacterium]